MSQGYNQPSHSKLRRWLRGTFTCTKCGQTFSTMSFGYGEAICPDCYKGEKNFLFFDKKYWLNRIISNLFVPETSPTVPVQNRIQTRDARENISYTQ